MRQTRQHRLSYIAKRFVMLFSLICFMVSPKEIGKADAQVFIMDEDEFMQSDRSISYTPGLVPVPPQGGEAGELDWVYTPLGDGLVPLLGLGVAYLLGRKRKKE